MTAHDSKADRQKAQNYEPNHADEPSISDLRLKLTKDHRADGASHTTSTAPISIAKVYLVRAVMIDGIYNYLVRLERVDY